MELKPLAQLYITSKFGPRVDPITKKHKSFHSGVDLRAAVNTPILAVADGKVVVSKVNNGGSKIGYGYYIVVQHDGFYTICGHLVKLGLPVGSVVKQGQIIGYSGNSGASTGPHLHFEVRTGTYSSRSFVKDSKGMMPNAVNPEQFKIEPLYVQILKSSNVNVELWKQYITEQSDHNVGKYIPELITKIYNSK